MSYYNKHTAPDGRPFISNSYLSQVKAKQYGIVRNLKDAYLFGRVFHSMLLEPHLTPESLPGDKEELCRAMVAATWQEIGKEMIFEKGSKREHEYYWKMLGWWFKCKQDHISKNKRVITDFKTTSQYSQAGFEKTVSEYDYDRQAYIYLKAEKKAEIFRLIGVQKSKKPNIFVYDITRTSIDYLAGYDKTIELLKAV